MNWDKIRDNLHTGDIILFSGKSFFSKFIEFFTGSNYSHIGMIVKTPINFTVPRLKTGSFFWESGEEPSQIEVPGDKVLGVQFTDLEKTVAEYDGDIYIRQLEWNLAESYRHLILSKEHEKLHNLPYDASPADWLKTYFGFSSNEQRQDSFFCSAFIGYLYCKLGLLPENTKWDLLEPGSFSESNQDLTLLLGAKLGPEIKLN